MTEHKTYSRKSILILAVAIVGFAFADSSWNLGWSTARVCEFINETVWVAVTLWHPFILAARQVFPTCFYDNSAAHLPCLFQLVTSIRPMLGVLAAHTK